MEQKFKPGDRVRLTRDLLDPAEYHPVNLYKGDEGTITEHPTQKGLLGFKSDRWGDIISFSDMVDGERRATIDFCELVEAAPAITDILERPKKLECFACGSKQGVDPITWECSDCGANFANIAAESDQPFTELKVSRWEVKTLMQDLDDSDADKFLSQALNEGWEILDLTCLAVYTGDESELEYRRIVTLRREVQADPDYYIDGVGFKAGGSNG